MSDADDKALRERRYRYLQLKAKAAAAEAPEEAAPAAPAAPSRLESAARGAGQGFTFGQGANINGLIQALGEKYLPESLGGGGAASRNASLADLFARNKGTFQRENDAAWEAHPWLYGGANALATIPTLFLGGAGARTAGTAPRMAELGTSEAAGLSPTMAGTLGNLTLGSGLAAKVGSEVAPSLANLMLRGGRSGLIAGGLAEVGNNLGDLLSGNYGRFATGVAANAIPGGILGSALAPVPGLVARAAPALQNFAYRQAVKAAGPLKADVLSLLSSGRLGSVGQKLLEKGIVPNGAGIEQIASRAAEAADTRGGDVHSILGELDALMPKAAEGASRRFPERPVLPAQTLTTLPPALEGRRLGDFPGRADLLSATEGTVNQRVPGLAQALQDASAAPGELPGFNPTQVGARLRAELLEPLRSQPALKGLAPGLQKEIENLESEGNRRITFQRANDIKRGYDKRLNWEKEQGPALELLKQVRGIVNEEIENKADAAATAMGDPDLLGRFRSAKQDYRDLTQVSDFAKRAVAGQEAKGFFSLPDYVAGVAPALGALASGHPLTALTGLAGAFGTKLARERGNSVAANVALGLSQRLGVPNNLTQLLSQRAASWPVRAQGQRTLYDLLGGATLPAAAQDSSFRAVSP